MSNKTNNEKSEEIRSLNVSLDKAVQWYLGDNKELRNIALELYSEKMLSEFRLETIKTFDDALKLYVRDRNTDKDSLSFCVYLWDCNNFPWYRHCSAYSVCDIDRYTK